MHAMVATLFLSLLLQTTQAAPGRVVKLVLPREPAVDESVWLEVKLGVIERGAEVELETTSGRFLGVISPHGIRTGDEAGTYTVPVPPDAVSNKRLSLRLTLSRRGKKRAPTLKEVKKVSLKITPTKPV